MRKSIFRTGVIGVVLSGLLFSTAFAETAVVSANDVNLRSGPGLNYSIIDCLAKGTALTVTDRSNEIWYGVSVDGVNGYMSKNYLKIAEEDTNRDLVSSYGTGTINAMYVRFRSGPSTDSSILGEYNKGKAVIITGTSGQWTAVTIDGQSGYVYSQYISTGNEPVIPEPQPEVEVETEENGNGSFTFGGYEESTPTPEPVVTPEPEPTPEPTEAPVEAPAAEEKAGYINGDDVRFRTGPSTGYTIIGSYNKGQELTITGTSGDWTACNINGKSGYVFSLYVKEGSVTPPAEAPAEQPQAPVEQPETPAVEYKDGYINGNNVRFRTEPSMSAGIITELYFGNTVTITGTSGDWTAVIYNGQSGYVYSQYVKEGSYTPVVPSTPAEGGSENTGSVTGSDIANYACQFVGYNYCWGGSSPSTGFDCSGLVYYTYKQFGYTLNRVAQDQANNGVHVDASQLQPGDILCFYSGSDYIGHSGIYIGDNKFVHSANSTTGVIISELSGYYNTRGFEARRIVN